MILNIGGDPFAVFKELAFHTGRPNVRSILLDYLSKHNQLSQDEKNLIGKKKNYQQLI